MVQLSYLETHPDIAVVGCAYEYINKNGERISIRKTYKSNILLKSISLLGSPFAHPGVMINRNLIKHELYYNANYKHAEDYELWVRLSRKYKFSSINQILLKYRILNSSISRQNVIEQKSNMAKAANCYIFNNNLSTSEVAALSDFYINRRIDYKILRIIFKQGNIGIAWMQFCYLMLKKIHLACR